jgi:hypothetical protein
MRPPSLQSSTQHSTLPYPKMTNTQIPTPTPGLLFASSKLTSPALLNESTYLHWYEDIHIPDVLSTRGFTAAFRYDAASPAAERPYLLLYPVRDLAFLRSKEFAAIRITSDVFPGEGAPCWDYADFDVRQYVPVGRYDVEGGVGTGEWRFC